MPDAVGRDQGTRHHQPSSEHLAPVISMVTTSDQRSCHRHDHWPGRRGFLPTVTALVAETSEDSALFPGLPSCFPQVVVSQQTLDVNFMRIFPFLTLTHIPFYDAFVNTKSRGCLLVFTLRLSSKLAHEFSGMSSSTFITMFVYSPFSFKCKPQPVK